MTQARIPIVAPLHAPRDSIALHDESDTFVVVSVVAVEPHGWRDAWQVLRGTYRPLVRRRRVLTTAGAARTIRNAWTPGVRDALYSNSPLLGWGLSQPGRPIDGPDTA